MRRRFVRRQGGRRHARRTFAPAPIVLGIATAMIGAAATPGPPPADGILYRYDLEGGMVSVELPRSLDEVSGLAFDRQGRLWAHDDERARVYRLDPGSGDLLSRFDVDRATAGDWEGIAWAEGSLFIVDSDGVLLRFAPGRPGETVPYRRIDTELGERCEIEGLGFDRSRRSLLLGCKTARERELEGRIVVLSFSLATDSEEAPRVSIPVSAVEAHGFKPSSFRVSALEIHPQTGSILIASAQDATVIEVAPDGGSILGGRVPGDRPLRQLEGLAVAPDGALLMASEASGRRAILARVPLGTAERP